jgi:hypothetical protein
LQTPPEQVEAFRVLHATQADPLVPQVAKLEVVQVPVALQQPLGQLVASQTQAPPTQRWPATQAAPVPQVQVPLALQVSA